jgi:hypothetical protein
MSLNERLAKRSADLGQRGAEGRPAVAKAMLLLQAD